jgi:hypothetical protein
MNLGNNKEKNKVFLAQPALQKILKGILHTEEEDKHKHENMGIKKLFIIRIDKQMKIRKESNIIKTTK